MFEAEAESVFGVAAPPAAPAEGGNGPLLGVASFAIGIVGIGSCDWCCCGCCSVELRGWSVELDSVKGLEVAI